MSVYAVVQIRINDVERFGKYQLGLRKIFPRSGGKMLVSEDAPCPHEVDGTQIPVHGDLVHAVQGQIRQPVLVDFDVVQCLVQGKLRPYGQRRGVLGGARRQNFRALGHQGHVKVADIGVHRKNALGSLRWVLAQISALISCG